jgi:hypothetical protein
MSRAGKVLRSLALGLAIVHACILLWLFARRVPYPYDLEWMEGGTLCHALRLLQGRPIYAPPSVEFIPFLYTPLYPALLAALGRVFGLGYLLGRLVSTGAFLGATFLAYRFAVREGGSRAAAATAMAIPAAAFVACGSWYDLARADSLWLLLATAGLLVLYRAARDPLGPPRRGRRAHALAALAAALLVASFFTKQTAAPLLVAAGAALVLLNLRLVPTFVLALAACGLPPLWWLDQRSGGWFWRYVFELHQSHAFFARRAWLDTPRVLVGIVGPALAVVPWAALRRSSPSVLYTAYLGLVGMAVACVGFGTQWAFVNAYVPGVFFPSLAIAVAAGRLVAAGAPGTLTTGLERLAVRAQPRLRAPAVFALAAASLALHPYDPRPLAPTRADREAGARLIEQLRATDGDVLVPFHPFYAHLAGKETFVHQMGLLDVAHAGLQPVGLADAIRRKRFKLVVLDDKIEGKWGYWPGLAQAYEAVGGVPSPRVFSGAMTVPKLAMAPRTEGEATHMVDEELQ